MKHKCNIMSDNDEFKNMGLLYFSVRILFGFKILAFGGYVFRIFLSLKT